MREFEFDVSDLSREVQKATRRLKNLPMDYLGQILIGHVDDMFQSEGAAGTAGAWEPLKQSTIERHPRRAGGMILQDTGATANIQVTESSNFSVTVASPTVQAQHHLDGTDSMVARDFFALRFNDVLDDMGRAVLEELAT